MRHVVLVLGLAACGPAARTGTTVPDSARTPASTSGPSAGTPAPPAVARDIGCPAPTCVFHAGTATYLVCTSSGAGSCFHFGPACTPADGCMYDPASRTYKQCAQASEGTCQQWGAACVPASKCMLDPRDGYHRTCEDASAGACRSFGALCAP